MNNSPTPTQPDNFINRHPAIAIAAGSAVMTGAALLTANTVSSSYQPATPEITASPEATPTTSPEMFNQPDQASPTSESVLAPNPTSIALPNTSQNSSTGNRSVSLVAPAKPEASTATVAPVVSPSPEAEQITETSPAPSVDEAPVDSPLPSPAHEEPVETTPVKGGGDTVEPTPVKGGGETDETTPTKGGGETKGGDETSEEPHENYDEYMQGIRTRATENFFKTDGSRQVVDGYARVTIYDGTKYQNTAAEALIDRPTLIYDGETDHTVVISFSPKAENGVNAFVLEEGMTSVEFFDRDEVKGINVYASEGEVQLNPADETGSSSAFMDPLNGEYGRQMSPENLTLNESEQYWLYSPKSGRYALTAEEFTYGK